MFIYEFCKFFKNIFCQNASGWQLLVLICEFWDFQITSFTEHLWKLLILFTSSWISTTTYSKQVFHMCFSSILYKKKKKNKKKK